MRPLSLTAAVLAAILGLVSIVIAEPTDAEALGSDSCRPNSSSISSLTLRRGKRMRKHK